MTQRKLLRIWQNLTNKHKMVLYAYLASCRDAPESCNDLSYYHPNKLGKRCDTDKFSNILIHSHPLKTEADFLMYEIALTKLIRWPFEESANSKPMIKTQIYDFLLFSSALSDKDLKLRDKFFDKVQLIKMTIMLKKDNAFILELIKSASLKKEQITEIFQIAVCLSPLELVKELVSLGADFKSPDKYERIAGIEAAAYQNDSSVFKFLAEKGFSLQARSFYDKNILHCAAQNSNPNILAYLLTGVPKSYLEEKSFRDGRTPLGTALLCERKKNMRLMIKAGADKTALKENNERQKRKP